MIAVGLHIETLLQSFSGLTRRQRYVQMCASSHRRVRCVTCSNASRALSVTRMRVSSLEW
jgi:hypothetical protein